VDDVYSEPPISTINLNEVFGAILILDISKSKLITF